MGRALRRLVSGAAYVAAKHGVVAMSSLDQHGGVPERHPLDRAVSGEVATPILDLRPSRFGARIARA
jgi:hypothetical protein